jgi:hypothetical protein
VELQVTHTRRNVCVFYLATVATLIAKLAQVHRGFAAARLSLNWRWRKSLSPVEEEGEMVRHGSHQPTHTVLQHGCSDDSPLTP